MNNNRIKLMRRILATTLIVLSQLSLFVSYSQSNNYSHMIENKHGFDSNFNLQKISEKKLASDAITTTHINDYIFDYPIHLKTTNYTRRMLDSAYGYKYTPESDSSILFKAYYTFDNNGNMIISNSLRYDTIYKIWFVAEKREYTWDSKGNNLSTALYYQNEYLLKATGIKDENIYDASGNITKNTKYNWIDSTNLWENNYRTETSYNFDGNRTEMTQYHWDKISGTWLAQYKYEFAWDDYGNCTSNIMYQADAITYELIPNLKTEYTYNEKQSTTSILYSYWDIANNNWLKTSKDEYTYNTNQDEITEKGFSWDTVKNSWFENYKNDYTYNGNGQQIAQVSFYRYISDSIMWIGDSKTETSYNADQKIKLNTYFAWDNSNNQWELSQRQEYSYSDSITETIIGSYYDIANTKWIENGKNETNYDSKSRVILNIFYTRSPEDTVWTGYSKREKNYDLNDNIILDAAYRWDYQKKMWIGQILTSINFDSDNNRTLVIYSGWGANDQWEAYQKQFFYYSQHIVFIPTSIVSKISDAFKIYPNPVENELTIDVSKLSAKSSVEVSLIDLTGKTLETISGESIIMLSMDKYKPSVYILQINTNGQIFRKKVIKK